MRPKKPSVSAAWISWLVISSMREEKSWREILGMDRSAYLVGAILRGDEGVDEGKD